MTTFRSKATLVVKNIIRNLPYYLILLINKVIRSNHRQLDFYEGLFSVK